MELHIAVTAEFTNNLDCFTFKNKRVGLLADGFSASVVSELRLKQKPARASERERERGLHRENSTDFTFKLCCAKLGN
jgi:hypothetical protein